MSTTTENKPTEIINPDDLFGAKAKKNVSAFIIDFLLWSYTVLVSWKIVFEKVIMGYRYPEFNWNQPLYCLAIGAVIAAALYMTPLSCGRAFTKLMKRDENKPILNEPFTFFLFAVLILTFIAGIFVAQVSITEFLSESGITGAKRIFTALFNPNFAILEQATFAAIETIYMAFIATCVALPIAFILAFFAARNLMSSSPTTMAIYSRHIPHQWIGLIMWWWRLIFRSQYIRYLKLLETVG